MAFLFVLGGTIAAFTLWCFYELVVVRRNKGVLWLGILFVGCAYLLSGPFEVTPVTRVLVQCWAYALVLLPVWWAVRAVVRAWRPR